MQPSTFDQPLQDRGSHSARLSSSSERGLLKIPGADRLSASWKAEVSGRIGGHTGLALARFVPGDIGQDNDKITATKGRMIRQMPEVCCEYIKLKNSGYHLAKIESITVNNSQNHKRLQMRPKAAR